MALCSPAAAWLAPCDTGPPGKGAVGTAGPPSLTSALNTASKLSPSSFSSSRLLSCVKPSPPEQTLPHRRPWSRDSRVPRNHLGKPRPDTGQGQPGSGTQKPGPCGVWGLGDRSGLAGPMELGGLLELDFSGCQHAVSHAPPCLAQAHGGPPPCSLQPHLVGGTVSLRRMC